MEQRENSIYIQNCVNIYIAFFFFHVGKLFSIGFQEVNSIRREFAVYAFLENNSDNEDHNEEHAFPIKPGFNYEFCKRHRFLS